jgi:L-cysteine S-thiosulfotransferase
LAVHVLNAAQAAETTDAANTKDTRRAGSSFLSAPLLALQQDDAQNPAMLWVKGGVAAWAQAPGQVASAPAASCQSCHGDITSSMKGVAARYPTATGTASESPQPHAKPPVQNLAGRINQCRTQRQGLPALPRESDTLLQLEAAIALTSRGLPITPDRSPAADALATQGQALWQRRMGQLDLSCAQCHDERAGLSLGGSTIPQAHATGYPVYRLEWQTVGSLARRMRGCLVGVRAQPFAPDAAEWLALEVWLARRAQGMAMEAPGVRP